MGSLKLGDYEALPPADERDDIVGLEFTEFSEVDWKDLAGLAALERLRFSGEGVYDLDDLPVMPRLRSLTIDPCPELVDVSALARQPYLVDLSLVSGTSRDRLDFASLAGLTRLRSLALGYNEFTDLSFVAGMPGLAQLDVASSRALREIGSLAGCRSLRTLRLDGCEQLAGVEPLAGLPDLRELWLSGQVTTALAPLAGTPLQRLVIVNRRIKDLPVDLASIAQIPGLESLEIFGAGLTGLDRLAGASVQVLRLARWGALTDLSSVGALRNLEKLAVGELPVLERLDLGAAPPSLRTVHVRECRALRDVGGLAGATGLEQVLLSWCPNVSDVSSLAALPALRRVVLSQDGPLAGLHLLQARPEVSVERRP